MIKVTIEVAIPEVGDAEKVPFVLANILKAGLTLKSIIIKGKAIDLTLESFK